MPSPLLASGVPYCIYRLRRNLILVDFWDHTGHLYPLHYGSLKLNLGKNVLKLVPGKMCVTD